MIDDFMVTESSTRSEWLDERRGYIGATDLSAILRLNPYATPLSVYRSKLGIDPPQAETAAMRRGIRLEPYIAQMYTDVTETPVVKWPGAIRHADKPYLAVNPDYAVPAKGSSGWARLVECKSHLPWLAHYYGEPGSDVIPAWEQVQCQWQCHLTGIETVDLVVMFGIGEDDLRIFTVNYNPETGAELEEAADRFWRDHIEKRVPPDVTGLKTDADLLNRLYPCDQAEVVAASDEINVIALRLRDAKHELNDADETVTLLENQIKNFMGDAAALETSMGMFTWKAPKSGSVSWKSIADAMGPVPPALVEQFTSEPSRRFVAPFRKGK